MASFDEALASPAMQLADVRRRQGKSGWGIALEQDLGATLGGFLRAGRHDGRTEPYSFAAIDDAVSAGLVWQREGHTLGLAWASQGLSASHRRFLAAGGSDFFLGDGRLNYGRERVLEAYCSAALGERLKLSLDLQQIAHPAYNRDRGPATTLALRLHAEM
jgi:carbohydrate-selective porin OprB